MLFGEYFHQIDAKGRVRIPGKLKAALGDGAMVTKGTGGCLFLFPREELQTVIRNKASHIKLSDIEAANPLRILFSSAQELEEDNQGRTMIPQNLRQFAKLEKDIVFIGVGDRAEIWERGLYDKKFVKADFDTALGALKEYGF